MKAVLAALIPVFLAPSHALVPAEAMLSIVKLQERASIEEVGSGTGFVIERAGKKLIISNEHVCEMATDGHMYIMFGRMVYKAKVLRVSLNLDGDLCILEPEDNLKPRLLPLKLSTQRSLKQFEQLTIDGHPRGRARETKTCFFKDNEVIARKFQREQDDVEAQESGIIGVLICNLEPGISGSPLLTKEREVVGVVFAIHIRHQHLAYFVTLDKLLEFLTAYETY